MTSAATTAFCTAKVEGPGGHLWIDGNGKITRSNGTLDAPKPNALSLVQIEDCPHSTPSCRVSCYVHGLEKHAPQVHALYRENSATMRRILAADVDTRHDWAEILADWAAANCAGGFRWHVSGDVISRQHAEWIAVVCSLSLGVPYWIYTRSFAFLEPLIGICTEVDGNLAINLSCDKDNYAAAIAARALSGLDLRLCYLSSAGEVPADLPEDSVIFPDYGLRGSTETGCAWFEALPQRQKSFVCPVDYHGKSEQRRCGPCARCLT